MLLIPNTIQQPILLQINPICRFSVVSLVVEHVLQNKILEALATLLCSNNYIVISHVFVSGCAFE